VSLLAIDFGGTRTRAAWLSADLQLVARHETLSRVDQTPEEVIARMIDTARQVVPDGAKINAIGIAAPGPLDSERGIIHYVKTIPGWHEVPLAPQISAAFGGAPTFMQNDGNVAVLAEYHLGAARGCDPAIYLTISTGVGGGAVINGKLFSGAHGMAIEPGHQQFALPDGRLVRWEELTSGTAIGHIAKERLSMTDQPSSLRDVAAVDGKAVGEAAKAGDAFALGIIEEAGYWLGVGVVNLMHLFNPQVIVLGGSVSLLGDLILNPANRVIAERILHPDFNPTDLLKPAQLGDNVCLFGAALYAQAQGTATQ